MERAAPSALPQDVPPGHVIVAGYGSSGKVAAGVLRAADVPLIVVELNHALYHDLIAGGFSGVWGDITSQEILHAAGVGQARILLMTVPDKSSVRLSVERARRLNPKMTVIARAVQAHHVAELHKLGVEAVVQPEFEGGVEMVRQALLQYHGDDSANARLLSAVRREFYAGV